MKKLIIIVAVLLLIFFGSYKIMKGFQETNEIQLFFKMDEDNDLKDLRVNLSVLKADGPSEWYAYEKTITVIDQGKVLTNFKSKYILSYEIQGESQLKKTSFNDMLEDNVFARKADYEVHYFFNNNIVNIKTILKDGFLIANSKTEGNIKYSNLKDNHNQNLEFFNPETTSYKITNITSESLNFLRTKKFEELKNVGKIKKEDIFKLDQLSHKEKIDLLNIHNHKKFNKPLE
ncbi:hypothetical protein [Acinetobacter bereziniae]|jgi:hypothetical protein|uniref:hypothetical protein n=1 Tax=Acinetobacter bereziniae TaxID=106648 RepID=UPI00125F8822|nr:hypothetical protein [Acinetobacter bereziniae]